MAAIATGLVLGGGGTAAAAVVGHDRQPAPASAHAETVAISDQDRLAAVDRADRATRADRPTPRTPTPSPAQPSPSASAVAPSRVAVPTPAKTTPKPRPVAPSWVMPMLNADITSCFGPRWGTEHQGIDFANDAGTPIRAASAGTVIAAGDDGDGYGNKVVVQHGPALYTLYGHGSEVLVSVGERVSAGQIIAREGSTGDATGPHLHFEVWDAMWSRLDPAPFLRAKGIAINGC